MIDAVDAHEFENGGSLVDRFGWPAAGIAGRLPVLLAACCAIRMTFAN